MANIKTYLARFMAARKGKDVKQDFQDCVLEINKEVEEDTERVNQNTIRQDALERVYDEQIRELANQNPQLPEIVDARQGMGTLGSIIKKKIFHFENVEEMKSCLTLVPGDVVQTLGYYEENDGGEGLYKVVNDVTLEDDGGTIHELENGLKAKLVFVNNTVNVKQFGAKGDGDNDDTQAIQRAINSNNKLIYLPSGTYVVDNLIFPHTGVIFGNGLKSIIKQSEDSTASNFIELSNTVTMKELIIYGNSSGDGIASAYENPSNGIYVNGDSGSCLNNLIVRYFKGNGCTVDSSYLVVRINNCIFGNNDLNGLNIDGHDHIISNTQCFSNRLNGFNIRGTSHKLIECYSYLNGCEYDTESPTARHGFNISAQRAILNSCVSEENFGHGFNIATNNITINDSLSTGNNVPFYDGAFKIKGRTIGVISENTKKMYDFNIGGSNVVVKDCRCFKSFTNKYNDYGTYGSVNYTTADLKNNYIDIVSDQDKAFTIGYNVTNNNYIEDNYIKINNKIVLTKNHKFTDVFTSQVTNIATYGGETIIKSRNNKVFMQLNISFDDDIPVTTKTVIATMKKLIPGSSAFGTVYANNSTNYNQSLYGYCEIDKNGNLSVFNYFNNMKKLTLVINYEL